MADNNLVLIVSVDVDKANRSIKTVNSSFKNMEQDAVSSASKVTAGIGSLESALLKGVTAANLLGQGVRGVIDLVKEWTVESAKLAARNDTLAIVNAQLGRVNGYNADALERLVSRIKSLGITTQAARDSVNKMIQAQLDLGKATQLARMAQDAAVVSGQNSSEAFEGILHGIATRNVRVLRTYGINLNLEDEFSRKKLQLGRDLTDIEKIQTTLDAVLEKGKIIGGSYEASFGSVGKQITTLARYVEEAKNALGHNFQEELKTTVHVLGETAQWIQRNSAEVAGFIKILGTAALGAAVGKFIGWMGGIQTALTGIAAAMEANPLVLIATAIAVGGAIVYKTYQDMKDQQKEFFDQQMAVAEKAKIMTALKQGKSMDDLKKMGITPDQVKKAVGGIKATDQEKFNADDVNFGLQIQMENAKEIAKLKQEEALKLGRAMETNREESLKSTRESYMTALKELQSEESNVAKQRIQDSLRVIEASKGADQAGKQGVEIALSLMEQRKAAERSLTEELAKEIDKRSNFVYEGKMVHRQLSPEELDNLNAELAAKMGALDLKLNEEESRVAENMWKAAAERSKEAMQKYFTAPLVQMLYVFEETKKLNQQANLQDLENQKAAITQRQDLEIARLNDLNAVTVQQKVWVERQKTQITMDAIQKRSDIEIKAIELRTQMDLYEAEKAARAQGIFDQERIDQILDRIRAISEAEKKAVKDANTNDVQTEQAKGAANVRKTVQEHYQSIFQSLKQQAGGVFDALLTKSQSVWKAIGDSLKSALLTAIKDVVTSRIAVMLMNMFVPGARAAMQQGGGFKRGGGGLLDLFNLGSQPQFGGAGVPAGSAQPAGSGSSQGQGWSMIMLPGVGPLPIPMPGPGGTAPFNGGTPAYSSTSGSQANAGSVFSTANLKNFFSLKNIGSMAAMGGGMLMLSGVQNHSAGSTIGGGALMGAGIGLSGGPIGALGGAGIGLALDGLRRGGVGGLGEDVAGGAMLGLNLGGPIGAAIGAGVGLVAGVVRLFIKGATQKAHDKIKSVYGVDISDQKFLSQIVKMANDTYGGNLDVAIRSKDIRDLILLYAQSTGQSTKGMPAQMSALTLSQSSGGLYQVPSYVNGQPSTVGGGLPSLDGISGGTASGSGAPAIVIPLMIDSQTVGTAVVSNGNVIAQGGLSAMKSNNGRREMTALQLSPGLVTR